LPPCPIENDVEIDVRSQELNIPGVTCKLLPLCPNESNDIDLDLDIRSQTNIPGVTCRLLPPCPRSDDLRSQINIAGVSCR
jgi:hypothetical protein